MSTLNYQAPWAPLTRPTVRERWPRKAKKRARRWADWYEEQWNRVKYAGRTVFTVTSAADLPKPEDLLKPNAVLRVRFGSAA